MELEWLGHACFRITTSGGTSVVIDPYDDTVGYGSLKTSADVLVLSHAHHDHSNAAAVNGVRLLIDKAGEYEFNGVSIKTIESFHDDAGGTKRGKNLLTRIEADGESVVHLGDLGHVPNDIQLASIKNADALLAPIGGYYTIDTPTAVKIIAMAAPKAAIPMHYKTEGNDFPISTADEFIRLTAAKAITTTKTPVSNLNGAVILPLAKN